MRVTFPDGSQGILPVAHRHLCPNCGKKWDCPGCVEGAPGGAQESGEWPCGSCFARQLGKKLGFVK